jgi:hypothetical protein
LISMPEHGIGPGRERTGGPSIQPRNLRWLSSCIQSNFHAIPLDGRYM